MTIADDVAGWIREAAARADSWESVRSELQARDPEGKDLRLRPFIFAFAYALHERSSKARERAGGPFGAMLAGEGWRFPPAVKDVDENDVAAWREGVAEINHPVVQARLGDLLWVRKSRPDPRHAARAASDGLREVAADQNWRNIDRVRCLSRALELARETRDADRQAAAATEMTAFAEHEITSASAGPGVPLGLVRPLVALPNTEQPDGLDECCASPVLSRHSRSPGAMGSSRRLTRYVASSVQSSPKSSAYNK